NSTRNKGGSGMRDSDLLATIHRFPRWHYQFDLQGHKTPIADTNNINRHEQRKNYFFQPMVELLGGSLEGKRVLDLGCNSGFWSLCAVENGCDYVLGIDGRETYIEQARFVFEAKGVDPRRYDFRCANVFEVEPEDLGTFDIVLCLGVLYHVSKHI